MDDASWHALDAEEELLKILGSDPTNVSNGAELVSDQALEGFVKGAK